MGSEQFPYKGTLSLVANRSFAQGTNAWTDTDHTAYTLSTAGEQGFLQMLPIYSDHILYPTIMKTGLARVLLPSCGLQLTLISYTSFLTEVRLLLTITSDIYC